ncbi:MAG: flagellar basal-body MS-ring/collar protein FliF [Fuerstiella sp.]|nr:flagellar M-ring protein FliF [Fuerstiella sp.]
MALFDTFKQQIRTLWSRWTNAQRIAISAAAVACVVGVIGTFVWATRADYVVLLNQLSPQRAAEIAGVLDTEQIEYELNFSGSAVSVPRSDVSRARLALKDVWEPDSESDSGMSGAFPGSPSDEADRRLRQREFRVAKSISKIRGIRSATVHISKPDPSPFVDEKTPTTASIIIDPASSGITGATAESIISLVSRAVEGLSPEDISLMDTNGRQFNASNGVGSTMDGHFEFRRRVELNLAAKADSMLALLLGEGKSVVRVTADIDFRESTRTEQVFDPDGKVKITEDIETVTQTGGVLPAGEVGFDANAGRLGDLGGAGGSTEPVYEKEILSTTYDTGSTEEVIRENPGKIIRLTVAAIVDLTPPAPPAAVDGEAAAPPAPVAVPIDVTQIESIIKQAVGFDLVRGDEIQVVNAVLGGGLPVEEPPGIMSMYQQYEPIVQTVVPSLIAGIAFLLGFLLLKKMKPVMVTDSSGEQTLSVEEMQRLAALSDQAKSNPEVAAKILAAWLESEEDQTNTSDATLSAAKAA